VAAAICQRLKRASAALALGIYCATLARGYLAIVRRVSELSAGANALRCIAGCSEKSCGNDASEHTHDSSLSLGKAILEALIFANQLHRLASFAASENVPRCD
jgi:hypothetical protein